MEESDEVKARFGGGPTSKLINRSKGGHSVKYLDLRVNIGLTWIKISAIDQDLI